jgi:hypothetical protein
MSKSMPNPDDKVKVTRLPGYGTAEAKETYGEITLNPLTAENLRDIARNESVQRSWRKAAVKLLLARKHPFVWHPELILMAAEIREELAAEQEVQDVVEQASEEPLEG